MPTPILQSRAVPGVLALVCLVVLAASVWQLGVRVGAFHEANPPAVWAFQPIADRRFTFAGRPVSLSDDNDAQGQWVVLQYADQERRLRVSIPGNANLPGLIPHTDWLRVLRFAESSGIRVDELQRRIDAGLERDRVVIVTRSPMPGADPATWGAVNRKAWSFDFYELMPDGTIEYGRFGFPVRGRPSLMRALRGEGPLPAGRPRLKEGTWQYNAAMQIMPPGHGPSSQTFSNDALSAAGWPMPASAFSLLAFIGFTAWFLAPRRRRA
jgi:hypothetical protein